MPARWIAFHVTDRCQLDCQHCLRDPAKKPKDLPLALIENILDQGKRIYNFLHVSLTGGEPTLHPEFEAVIDAIVDRGFTWHIVTNGKRAPWLVDFLNARPTRKTSMTSLNISFDGADEAVHDRLRGKGSYRDAMMAAMVCHAHGLPFLLNVTLNALNQHQIEGFALLGTKLGASRVQFGMMQPTGTMHDETLGLSAREWRALAERIEQLKAAFKIDIQMSEGFPKEARFHACDSFKGEPLHIDLEGQLTLCCQHAGVPGQQRDVAGDLAKMPLVEAHRNLLGIIREVQDDRLSYLSREQIDEWDAFPCNWCLKNMGRPHWTTEGARGPQAERPRWAGAWSPEHQEARNGGAANRRLRIVS